MSLSRRKFLSLAGAGLVSNLVASASVAHAAVGDARASRLARLFERIMRPFLRGAEGRQIGRAHV